MNTINSSGIRKRLLAPDKPALRTDLPMDLAACATIEFSSEDPDHPVDHIVDQNDGLGGTYWSSHRQDTPEQLVIAFDTPSDLSRLVYEVEEPRLERTQAVRIEISRDSGRTYRAILIQEYVFSPHRATPAKQR